jgi:hypothetical protein
MNSRAPLIAFGGSVGFTAVMATIGMGLGRQWVQIDSLVWADTWLATFLFLLPCIAVTLTPAAIAVVVALRNAPPGHGNDGTGRSPRPGSPSRS